MKFPLATGARWAGRFRRQWFPLLLLVAALATVYLFGDEWGHWGRLHPHHDWNSAQSLAFAENLSPRHNFLVFRRLKPRPEGATGYGNVYNRFPLGGYVLIKLVILPFGDNLSAKVYAGQMLMLLMFGGAAVLAYLSLRRITARRRIALAATLLAFSSYYVLTFDDMISNEVIMDLFAVMLVFHGITVYGQERRFGQLLAKCGVSLLIGWHVYALLLPFIIFGLGGEIIRASRAAGGQRPAAIIPVGPPDPQPRGGDYWQPIPAAGSGRAAVRGGAAEFQYRQRILRAGGRPAAGRTAVRQVYA